MFEYLGTAGSELHAEMLKIYWVLVIPFVLLLFGLELLKDESPNARDIIRRFIISVLMLLSFDWCINSIASIGDAVTSQIGGMEQLSDVLTKLGPNYSGHDSWFSLRETTIYIFSLAAYIIAYLGFFVATALTHFVWAILYVCSPLMILMYVSRSTSYVTASLYKGLIQVVIWKILWSILGVLLLKLAVQPQVAGMEDYLMAIVMNLCIGVSMLFIPLATKSLISDGMNSVASTLALAPAFAASGAVKLAASRFTAKASQGIKSTAAFAAKPVTNPIAGRAEQLKDRLRPRFERFKQSYGKIGLPKEIINKQNKERKKYE
jgi:hypothetical protein